MIDKNWKNPIKFFWRKWNKIKKEEEPKIDEFDFFMLKYGSYIRIGENRTYIKYCKDASFRFLVLFDPEICLCHPMLMISEGLVKDNECARKMIASIEFSGELLILQAHEHDKFTNACIYAMQGQFTQDSRKVEFRNNNRELRYEELRNAPKNENFQCDMIKIGT